MCDSYSYSVIVIDKPIGLAGTVLPQHQYLCHIYVPYITKMKDLKTIVRVTWTLT